jgi:hypothetical protein
MPCSYSNPGAPGAAASEPLAVETIATVKTCEGFFSMIFVVSKASGRSL